MNINLEAEKTGDMMPKRLFADRRFLSALMQS